MIPKVNVAADMNTISISFEPAIIAWTFPADNERQFSNLIFNIIRKTYIYEISTPELLTSIKAEVIRLMCQWIANGSIIIK